LETFAIPIPRCSFGIINWNHEDVQELGRKTREMLNVHGQCNPRADIDRLYVLRAGLVSG